MIIWRQAYRPFMMGGDVNVPVGTEVKVGEKIDLGGGYSGYLVENPYTGETRVAESVTGAILGNTIELVREDIETGDPVMMAEQVAWAVQVVEDKKVEVQSAEDFWRKRT